MRKLTDVLIPMPDGVRLAADVYLPDRPGRYPALVTLLPYGKGLQAFQMEPQNVWDPLWCSTIEAGDSRRLTENGYAHMIVDVRGTGHSEGVYANMFAEPEKTDGYHVVEWAAKQDWCDGGIGMFGTSYLAMSQYFVAAQRPPHLKAIFPFRGVTDIYRELTHHGGVLELGFFNPNFWSLVDVGTAAPGTPSEEIPERVKAAMADPNIGEDPFLHGILLNWKRNPVLFDFLLHPFDGPFYRDRSAAGVLADIEVPSFVGAVWTDTYLHLGGAFQSWEKISSPKRMIIGPCQPKRPFFEYHGLMIRWFDHWLRGVDNGVMSDPPILMWGGGRDEWRWEHEWPLKRTCWQRYYLGSVASLSPVPPETPDSQDFTHVPPQISGPRPPAKVSYQTAPFDEDVEFTGPIALRLYAEIDAEDTHWIVRLFDVDEDNGADSVELTQGFLRASHRAVDESRSAPGQPFHPHTAWSASPVRPGEVCAYDIGLQPTSRLIRRGRRLRVEIASSDFSGNYPNRHHFHHLPIGQTVHHRIVHSPEHPSHLLLPAIPQDGLDRTYRGPDPLS